MTTTTTTSKLCCSWCSRKSRSPQKAAAVSAKKAWSSGDQFAVKNGEAFAFGKKRRRRMNTTARANNAADTTDEDAFADVDTQKNAASSSESSLSSSLRESLAKELSVLLSKVHLGAPPLTAQESFEARKNRLEKALLMATLLEKEEHDDHEYDDEKRTIQTTKTSTFLSRTRTTNTKTNDDENILTETIARELINHDVLGRYMNEIARFAYIRKTSHSGAASRRRAKRPKDRASNQKKPRQGLTREDMRTRAQKMVRGVSSVREERRRVIGDESFEYRRHIVV